LARDARARHKKKVERLRNRFPRKVDPMNLSDTKDPQKEKMPDEDPEPTHSMAKVQSVRISATQAEEVRDKERRMKVEKWEAEKEQIESQYLRGRWPVATFHQRFMELVKWFGDRPLGGNIHPTSAPWPIFRKPSLMEPEDVTTEEVEYFLLTLRNSTDRKTFASHVKNLRIRFHPDKWQTDFLKLEDTEVRKRWERALLNTSQVISVMYNEQN